MTSESPPTEDVTAALPAILQPSAGVGGAAGDSFPPELTIQIAGKCSGTGKRKSHFDLGLRSPGKKPCSSFAGYMWSPTPAEELADVAPHIQEWLNAFLTFRTADKLAGLTALVKHCDASQIQHVKQVVNPLLQRDFVTLLPKELSMYILSLLPASDLLHAAHVCRFWRSTAEDIVLWREKCEEGGISPDLLPPAPPVPPLPVAGTTRIEGQSPPANQNATPLKRRCYWKAVYMRYRRIENNWRGNTLPSPQVMRGHDDHVITCLKLCDDVIISGSDDNTLRVWSAATGQSLQTLVGHTGGVWACQVSTESRVIVSGSTDRTVRVWDMDSGNCRNTLVGHTSTVRCVALKGSTVVTGSRDATLRVWDIESGECLCVLQGHLYAIRCVRFDGRLAVSGSYDFDVRVWDVEAKKCIRVFKGHTQRVYSLQYDSPRGIVVSGSLDTTLRVWSIPKGACLHSLLGHKSLNSALDLRANLLMSGNADSMVKIWDISTGQCLHTLSGDSQHKSAVTGLQLLNNGLAITCSDDGTVKIWDVQTGKFIRDLINLDSGGAGGVIWRLKASLTRLVCAVGSRNGVEDTKLLLLDFNAGYP